MPFSQHYNTVVKPEILYASEILAMTGKGKLENIRKVKENHEDNFRGKTTEEGYKLQQEKPSNIAIDMIKKRLQFNGHINRLAPDRLTNKIVSYIQRKKTTTPW